MEAQARDRDLQDGKPDVLRLLDARIRGACLLRREAGRNGLQLRPTGVHLPQPGSHTGNSGINQFQTRQQDKFPPQGLLAHAQTAQSAAPYGCGSGAELSPGRARKPRVIHRHVMLHRLDLHALVGNRRPNHPAAGIHGPVEFVEIEKSIREGFRPTAVSVRARARSRLPVSRPNDSRTRVPSGATPRTR